MRRFFFFTVATIVFGLVALLLYTEVFSISKPALTRLVSEAIPSQVDGWMSRNLPIADSPGMVDKVESMLRYDSFLYREYQKPGLTVTVYAAYWKPGKTTTMDAGMHNPDSCWISGGWKRLDRKYAVSGDIAGRALHSYEFGIYEYGTVRIPVMFWHLVNSAPNRYEGQDLGWTGGWAGKIVRLPMVLKDIRERGLAQKSEQMFIRVCVTGLPPSIAMTDPDFIRLMHSLDGLGIFADRPWR